MISITEFLKVNLDIEGRALLRTASPIVGCVEKEERPVSAGSAFWESLQPLRELFHVDPTFGVDNVMWG